MPKPKKRKKRWDAGLTKEQKMCQQLWNWVCLGACIESKRQSDRWLRTLKEMEDEMIRYKKDGCKCGGYNA